jgi:ABC-2 type transport system ATP-binding protein
MTEVVLQTEALTRRYGDLVAVNGLSLEVRRGEVFGLLGPNGAGKTTAISMMCGLLAPDSGRTLIDGQPVAAGSADVRAKVGVCPQEIVIWKELSCLEQLCFVADMYDIDRAVSRRRAEELLDRLGLADRGRSRARTLSGGMKRRLNVALALIHDPEIVVLDEPEAGLDPQSRVLVRDYVKSLARRKTVILTTHNMDEAQRVSDRVAIIDRGELLVVDSPENMIREVGASQERERTLEDVFISLTGRRLRP